MSGEPEGASYDPVELGRRIVFAFSAGELQRFAQDLGVAAEVRWDRGHAEAARDVVRQFEKSYGGLPTLVDRLRTAKPLVEWPDPGLPPSQMVPAHPSAAPAPAVAHAFGQAPVLTSPGSLGGPPGPTIPQAPSFAPPIAPIPPQPVAPAPPPAMAAPPPNPAWPGTFAPAGAPKAASNGLDPKILIVVAGLMVVAAVIAYFAGRAGNAPVADAGASPTSTAPAAHRPDGPATRLATFVDRRIANVARACEVPNGPPGEVFSRSFEQCGPAAQPRPTPRRNLPPPEPRPTAAPDDQRVRTAGREGRPREAPGASCVKSCAAENAACRQRCGPEPNEASRYGSYQQCTGRCISAASKCRLGCP